MINDKVGDELMDFVSSAQKQITRTSRSCEVEVTDKKRVTIIGDNEDLKVIRISSLGSVTIEGDWLTIFYDASCAVAGFKVSHVKSWWVSV